MITGNRPSSRTQAPPRETTTGVDFFASALAGRPVRTGILPEHQRAWWDGETVWLPPGPWARPSLITQCALLAAEASSRGSSSTCEGVGSPSATSPSKTRFVEHMAHELQRPLITVSCHDDLSASDLVGRHLLERGETIWHDGPLLRAVRPGAICYLDEVVEARQDTTVVMHPLSDHRRQLHVERLGETFEAGDDFMQVLSFNPGYQSIKKDLKDSTRRRFVTIELGHPPFEHEIDIVVHETGIDAAVALALVQLGHAIRRLPAATVREVASARTLVSAAHLIAGGPDARRAARAAIVHPIADDQETLAGLATLVDDYLGGSDSSPGPRQ